MPPYPTRRFAFSNLLLMAAAFLAVVDSPNKVAFEPRQGRIENGACGRDRDVGRSVVSLLATLSPGQPLDARFLQGAANDGRGRKLRLHSAHRGEVATGSV
jgi:hypothetical protein